MKNLALALVLALIITGGTWYMVNKDSLVGGKNIDMFLGGDENVAVQDGVEYFENSYGYYAYPKKEGNYPGVVMVHEWWGLNDNIKDMARVLAAEGYRVLAVDLYHGKVATDSTGARGLVSSVDQSEATSNMKAAVAYLKQQGATKMASLGWCFGGGQSLQLAISGEPLDATVLYYGTPLVTDASTLTKIKWPVLGIFGDQDAAIPTETVGLFQKALDADKVANEIHIYPGVGHAFANPSGANYAPNETKDAWAKTVAFLAEQLK